MNDIEIFLRPLAQKQTLNGDILIKIGPMDAKGAYFVVFSLFRCGQLEPWIPFDRHHEDTSILKGDRKLLFREINPQTSTDS